EPEVWKENRRKQREQRHEFRLPLFDIFRARVLWNTFTACLWMASGFVVYYTVFGLFATHLQKDLHFSPGLVALPLALTNAVTFLSGGFWGIVADRLGRRWAMIIPAFIGLFVTPFYLGFFTDSYAVIVFAFVLQGFFVGGVYGQNPAYLTERFPTEVRATAAGFCYHQGAIFGGLAGPILAAFAVGQSLGFAIPMLVTTTGGLIVFMIALLLGPETKGHVMISDLTLVAEA
ncbi:MAG: MFS transporter, partial [Acetobacteraceae bacterium]